jgi:hypothetical protein
MKRLKNSAMLYNLKFTQFENIRRSRNWLNDKENLLFVALIALLLIPLWTFKYFPSQDGPSHLDNANVVREYHAPDRIIFREDYTLNNNFGLNWLGYLILGGLMSIVPVTIAEKIFLSGYVIFLPVAFRGALRAIRPDSKFIGVMIFPFVYNYFLHMGFYNFLYGLVIFFFTFTYWLKHYESLTARNTLTLTILFILLYLCHPLSFLLAGAGLIAFAAGQIFLGGNRGRPADNPWKMVKKTVFPLFGALAPTFFLSGICFLSGMWFLTGRPGGALPRLSLPTLWGYLFTVEPLVSYQRQEAWCAIAMGWLFLLIIAYVLIFKPHHYQRNVLVGGFLPVVASYVLLYFIIPNTLNGADTSVRISLYIFLALLLWFAAQSYSSAMKGIIRTAATAIAVTFLVMHTFKYAELNKYLNEYLSGSALIKPNTTLLALNFSSGSRTPDGRELSLRIKPFLHAAGYIAAERKIVSLNNSHAWFVYFPTLFRHYLNPRKYIGKIESEPPEVEFLNYPLRTGKYVDYVLVWKMDEKYREHPVTQFINQQLAKGYRLIYTSPQRGFMKLYCRKGFREI